MNHKQDKNGKREEDVERTVFEAMRQAGWILPRTPQEVLRAEKDLSENPVSLPEGLSDPYAVLERPSRAIRIGGQTKAPRDVTAEQNLAQAAREGGEIAPDVSKQMRKDREAAEREDDE